MASANGIATLHFDAAPQAAEYVSTQVVTDSVPDPNVVTYVPYEYRTATHPLTIAAYRIVYGNGVYVMLLATTISKIAYSTSPDGPWTAVTLPGNDLVTNIVFGSGLFVTINRNTGSIYYSKDAVTWNTAAPPVVSAGYNTISYARGIFLAVTDTLSTSMRSVNGITWVSAGATPTGQIWGPAVAEGAGVFVICAASTSTFLASNAAASSPDGVVWTLRTMPSAISRQDVRFVGDRFLSAETLGATISYSTDGLTWFSSTLPVSTSWGLPVFGNGVYIIMSSFSAIAARSVDGVNWTKVDTVNDLASNVWTQPAYSDGVIISSSGAAKSCYSIDGGLTWVGVSTPTVNNQWVVANGNFFNCSNANASYQTYPCGLRYVTVSPTDRTITTLNTEVSPYKPNVGSNVATVTIAGQTTLLATDLVEAWVQGSDSTADHNIYEHDIAPIKLSVTNVVAGTGFDIVGTSEHRLDGDFKVRWARAT